MRKIKREKKMLRVYRFIDGRRELVAKACVSAPEDPCDLFKEQYTLVSEALKTAGVEADRDDIMANFGSIYTKGAIQSSYDRHGASSTQSGPNCTFFGTDEYETVFPESGYGYDIYRPGMLLSIGKKGYNILGYGYDQYFIKFTPKKVHSGNAAAGKTGSVKDFLKLLRDKEDIFRYCVTNLGYTFSVEYTCPYAEEDDREALAGLSGNRLKKHEEDSLALETLLGCINRAGQTADTAACAFGGTPEEEALRRMKEFGLYGPVLTRFKKDRGLFMSFPGGALYDPDETALGVAEEVRQKGLLPYHVIVGGDGSYSVLYVGPRDEWEIEVMDRQYDCVMAYVYNPHYECREFGSIGVASANGGLMRTA